MGSVKTPLSLRAHVVHHAADEGYDFTTGGKVTVACLLAVGSIGTAEAQQSTLPPVTIDAPVVRPRPPAAKPTAEQTRVRNAIRRQARQPRRAPAAPVAAPSESATQAAPDANPYANPNAPYYANRLASQKFSEPIANQARSITVLTKELLADKNATNLKEVARTTAGVTLGTGEGGNAFGDRFFIRGFDARNDIFIDGIRDPAVSIRENFFTEQVEILRGPASSFAGRGTTGGALNIVTKQAGDKDFTNVESTFGTDATKRVTVDTNKVISPTLSIRLDAMGQGADVAGRNYVFDDRWGTLGAVKWTPTNDIKVTANYVHVNTDQLPDFGVPYNNVLKKPFTDLGVSRDTFYGFVNRDFQRAVQDFGTIKGQYDINNALTFNNTFRAGRSVLDYVGTLPEAPNLTALTVSLNPQSRYQVTNVIANQSDFTYKFDTGPIKHTTVFGAEISNENVSRDTYTGLTSEALPGGFSGTGQLAAQSIFNPPNLIPFPNQPQRANNPTVYDVNTASGYFIETANYQDFIILNGGVRFDDYSVKSSNITGSTSADNGMLNYNVGLVVKPLPFASVYGAYATSSNPVGAELDGNSALYGALAPSLATGFNQVFAPERNEAIEVGTKWELFDRRMLATAALFQTTKDNAREVIPNGQPNAGLIVAGASFRVQGVDFGLSGKITDKWSVFAGLVLFDSEVTKSAIAADVGMRLANVAHQSFNVLSKYKVTDKIEVGGQATYRSKVYGGTNLAATSGAEIPDYWRFDTFAEYKIDKTFTAKVFVNNIFDKLYYDALYQSAAPFVFVAPGRSASFVLSAKF